MSEKFIVRASTILNFFPGSMLECRDGYPRILVSKPMSREEAAVTLEKWRTLVKSDKWEFEILPADES